MPWQRRRSKWPFFAALTLLLVATAAAPWAWSRFRAARYAPPVDSPRLAKDTFKLEQSEALPVRPRPEASHRDAAAPALPPLASTPQTPVATASLGDIAPRDLSIPAPIADSGAAAPLAAADSMVAADDYVAVDEPLVEPTPFDPTIVAKIPEFVRGLVARLPAAPSVADQPALTLPAAVPVVPPAEPAPAPRRVIVESENDRLAMIPEEPQGPRAVALVKARPESLLAQLAELRMMAPTAAWAEAVAMHVETLCTPAVDAEQGAQATIGELRSLAMSGLFDAMKANDPTVQSAWLRASRSLERRLALWQALANPETAAAAALPAPDSSAGMPEVIRDIAQITQRDPAGQAWHAYLRLDDLAAMAGAANAEEIEARGAAARQVLVRMTSSKLTAEQKQFLAEPTLAEFARLLRPWAATAVSLDELASLVERYEARGGESDADAIADLRLRLKWSANPELVNLAAELNRNYRNANVRVAFSRDLINRLIPPQEPMKQRVHEHIAGADVAGRSETTTKVEFRMAPNTTGWNFELAALGDVKSRTYSESWPARVYNSSKLKYEVTKEIVLDPAGLRIGAAKAKADGTTSLVGIDSALDPVPLVGSLVESAARRRHQESRSEAIAQVKSKVTRQARTRMDREGDAKIHNLESRISEAFYGPLNRLSIAAEPVDMSTTDQRAVVRLRVAEPAELAAHTPRPSAPADSLFSIQLHESALNNAVRGLGLDGKRITVGELHTLLSEKIARRAEAAPADVPQKAIVEFARRGAIHVACHSDRVELVLNFVELKKGRDSIKNFSVHAFYRPEIEGLQVKLVRDGSLQFDGAHLRMGSRGILQTVFNKILRKDQEAPVLAARFDADPRFAGLMVTQLVIDDGWVALSVGPASPARTAWRTRAASAIIAR